MRCTNIFPGLVASILFITGTVASPCKPKTTQQSSDSQVSVVTQSSSSEVVSTVDATSTETTSTDVALIDVPSTEATFQASSEASSGATTEVSADTTVLTSVTTEIVADTTTWITVTTEASTDTTTWLTETSAVETTTTSEAPPSITTFSLRASNSEFTSANGKWVLINASAGMRLGPAPNPGNGFETGRFSIEPGTNYLKIDDYYVVAPESTLRIGLSRSNSGSRYIVCTTPVAKGEKLSCEDMYGDWDRWAVDSTNGIFLRYGMANQFYFFMDLIVS